MRISHYSVLGAVDAGVVRHVVDIFARSSVDDRLDDAGRLQDDEEDPDHDEDREGGCADETARGVSSQRDLAVQRDGAV